MAIVTRGTYNFPVALFIEECCTCGMPFGMPKEFKDRLRESRDWFHCPAGHRLRYTGTSTLQLARERAAHAESDADYQRSQRRVAERRLLTSRQQHGKTRASLKRMREDTCPICEQTFPTSKLTAHMDAEHPVVVPVPAAEITTP